MGGEPIDEVTAVRGADAHGRVAQSEGRQRSKDRLKLPAGRTDYIGNMENISDLSALFLGGGAKAGLRRKAKPPIFAPLSGD